MDYDDNIRPIILQHHFFSVVLQNAIARVFWIYFIPIVQSRFINSPTDHSSLAFKKEMADSEHDRLSI